MKNAEDRQMDRVKEMDRLLGEAFRDGWETGVMFHSIRHDEYLSEEDLEKLYAKWLKATMTRSARNPDFAADLAFPNSTGGAKDEPKKKK